LRLAVAPAREGFGMSPLQAAVLLSVGAQEGFCLHCECPIEPGLASGLCVECYLDALYSDGEFELPLEDDGADEICPFCCKPLADCDCAEAADDEALGAPCPGSAFVPF
jgi:hypothetical protein